MGACRFYFTRANVPCIGAEAAPNATVKKKIYGKCVCVWTRGGVGVRKLIDLGFQTVLRMLLKPLSPLYTGEVRKSVLRFGRVC